MTIVVSHVMGALLNIIDRRTSDVIVCELFKVAAAVKLVRSCTVIEFMGPSFRAYAVILHNIAFALGFMALSGMAYFARDFTLLQLVFVFPVFLSIAYIW